MPRTIYVVAKRRTRRRRHGGNPLAIAGALTSGISGLIGGIGGIVQHRRDATGWYTRQKAEQDVAEFKKMRHDPALHSMHDEELWKMIRGGRRRRQCAICRRR